MTKDRAKSPPKKGGKKTPEMQAPKEGSKLKKRGEEDEDSKFIGNLCGIFFWLEKFQGEIMIV